MSYLTIFVILLLALYGIVRSLQRKNPLPSPTATSSHPAEKIAADRERAIRELRQIETPEYLYRYIVHVINHGSHGLGFPGGEMEGGYVAPDLAPDIACYVMELGGHRCPHPYSHDAQMYYSSVCAGCHGLDGKGLHGTYPDLTRPTLLGIERRKALLRTVIHP